MIRPPLPSLLLTVVWLGPALLAHAADDARPAVPPAQPPAVQAPAGPAAPTAVPATGSAPGFHANANPVEDDEIRGLLNLGASMTDRGGYETAEIAFHQVLNHRDVTVEDVKSALLGLARMHRRQGALTKAVAIYERFLKDYPGDERIPDALLNLGRTLRSLGLHRLAIGRFYNVLNSTLKITSGHFEHYQLLAKTAQFEIAQTHFEAGSYAEADKFFTRLRLLDLAPADRSRAHFMSACSLRLQGNREAAIASLRSFLDQSPEDENIPEARYLLALTLHELNRPQEAFAATLDLLHTEKSRTDADPKRWAYWQRRTGNQLANFFFESGDTLNAQAIYTGLRELATEPNWRLPLTYQIALCAERLGALDRACASYQEIVDTAGAPPPAGLAELVRMAAWRIEHVKWRHQVEAQVTSFFSPSDGPTKTATPSPSTAAVATIP